MSNALRDAPRKTASACGRQVRQSLVSGLCLVSFSQSDSGKARKSCVGCVVVAFFIKSTIRACSISRVCI
eukprot:2982319-Rhodomonas_salina.2